MSKYIDNQQLREWLQLEIRLAMQQEAFMGTRLEGTSGLDRAAIASVRAERILLKLDYFDPGELVSVSQESIDNVKQILTE